MASLGENDGTKPEWKPWRGSLVARTDIEGRGWVKI